MPWSPTKLFKSVELVMLNMEYHEIRCKSGEVVAVELIRVQAKMADLDRGEP